jgi:hypothetical protein
MGQDVRVPDLSNVTHESIDAAVQGLSGQRIATVHYFGLALEDGDWDLGTFHQATMGVELICEGGQTYFATWGDAFGQFGLELMALPAEDVLQNGVNEQRDFSQHEWWETIRRGSLTAELVWRVGYVDSDDPSPVALHLRSTDAELWIVSCNLAAHDQSTGQLLLGVDEVVVTADLTCARELGLSK